MAAPSDAPSSYAVPAGVDEAALDRYLASELGDDTTSLDMLGMRSSEAGTPVTAGAGAARVVGSDGSAGASTVTGIADDGLDDFGDLGDLGDLSSSLGAEPGPVSPTSGPASPIRAGDDILRELYRLGAVPEQPLSPMAWHDRAAALDRYFAHLEIQRRHAASLAHLKRAETPAEASRWDLMATNFAAEAARLRADAAADEKANAMRAADALDRLGSPLDSSHTADKRRLAWELLLPTQLRERSPRGQATDQRFVASIMRHREYVHAANITLHNAVRVCSMCSEQLRTTRALVASIAASSSSSLTATGATTSTTMMTTMTAGSSSGTPVATSTAGAPATQSSSLWSSFGVGLSLWPASDVPRAASEPTRMLRAGSAPSASSLGLGLTATLSRTLSGVMSSTPASSTAMPGPPLTGADGVVVMALSGDGTSLRTPLLEAFDRAGDEAFTPAPATSDPPTSAENAAVGPALRGQSSGVSACGEWHPPTDVMIAAAEERSRSAEMAVDAAQARLDEAKRAMRDVVREHLRVVLRLVNLPTVEQLQAQVRDTPAAALPIVPAPTPLGDRTQSRMDAPPPDTAQLGPASSSSSSSSSGVAPAPITMPLLDHSLGAAVTSFALAFGKVHPITGAAARVALRWLDPSQLSGRRASGGGESREGISRWPPCMYPPGKEPWGAKSFSDDEALFEDRPPSESLVFGLAVQDMRQFAFLLTRHMIMRYPQIIPALPSSDASRSGLSISPVRRASAAISAQAIASAMAGEEDDPAVLAHAGLTAMSPPRHGGAGGPVGETDKQRAVTIRERTEWIQFLQECSLDAVQCHCYETVLALAMDRWGSRDSALMGDMWHLADAEPAEFDIPPALRLDGTAEGLVATGSWSAQRRVRGARAEAAFAEAIALLRSLPLQRTARHKCAVLARAMSALAEAPGKRGASTALGAEDLMPLLAWAIARSRQPALLAQMGFIQTMLPERLLSQSDGYVLTAITVAVHTIRSVAIQARERERAETS